MDVDSTRRERPQRITPFKEFIIHRIQEFSLKTGFCEGWHFKKCLVK